MIFGSTWYSPALACSLLVLIGCRSPERVPLPGVAKVELARFMGDWHVIASIPTFIEREAYNAVESYRLDSDGTIATTFTFRQGGFDGPAKHYTPRGFVIDRTTNAIWGMRFIWPIKADYRIVHLDEPYTQTIIGRDKRDFVWIMARTPDIPESDYQHLLQRLAAMGYDPGKLRKVPQRWPQP